MSWTTRLRIVYAFTFVAVTATATVGWLYGFDPSMLNGVLMFSAGAVGVGEASNVGKRATFKKEAVGEVA